MKLANIFQRAGAFLIHPSSRTTDGVWILESPCVRLRIDVSDETLGQTVLAQLKASRTGVPHPTDWKSVARPLLDAAEVRSWSTFTKGTLSVKVMADGDIVQVTPTANLGARGGFEELLAERRSLEAPSAQSLGTLVREAIESAR